MKNQSTGINSAVFKSLETLRIAAAVAVVLAHSGEFNIPLLHPFLGGSVFLGSLGVDVFFVISGFVMGIATTKSGTGVQNAISFVISRLLRLFPLYALVTVAAAAYLVANGKPLELSQLFQSLIFLPTSGPSFFLDPLVGMGWTLRFEMYFYLLVSVGIAFDRKILVPMVGVGASFIAWIWNGFYFGAPLVLEFMVGFLLSIYKASIIDEVRVRLGYVPFLVGMFASLGLLLLVSTGHDWGESDHAMYSQIPRLWIVYEWGEIPRVVAWGGPAALLVYFCLGLEENFDWKLSFLGKYTYAVYLLQFFVLPIAVKLNKFKWMPDIVAFGIGAILLAVGSVISLRFIEMPALKLRNRFSSRRSSLLKSSPRSIV
ncbi:acyltransferase family protein [Massilia sp. LXY-6]|uniref:acyltransferase family protein n=1 Tax=Massilia sp. LXY-6 TaxID=3379823 RepID=UPI003EE3F1AC